MKTLSTLLIAFIFVSPALAVADAGEQTQSKSDEKDKQLRLKAELVQVRAVVTDKRGQPVTGLKKEDFELLEENRPQEISFFSAEDLGNPSGSPKKPDDVTTLRTPTQDVSRTIVLFVDTVHTSFENIDQTKRALRRFVDEQMSDGDLVALITSSGSLGLMEQFTRSRQILRAGIERLAAWHASAQETLFTPYLAAEISKGDRRSLFLGMEILRTEEVMQKEVRDELLEPMVKGRANQVLAEASNRRKITLATLRGVLERVAEMPGQRMIAIFSEGFSLSGYGGGSELNDLQPPINRAVRSGVVIYTIAAQGLKPIMIPASQPGIVSGRRRENPATRIEIADLSTTMAASERDVQIGLSALAKDTGGEAFFNTNDLNSRLQKALNDNRIYYALGYHVSNDSPVDSRKQFRRISLRVRNHPEYKIRTQRGYQPFEEKPESAPLTPRQKLVQAMSAPLPVTTIPVTVSADYFERESLAGQAYIQIYIDANALRYRQQDSNYFFDLDTAITIYDVTGKRVHVSTNVANGSFTPPRLEIAKRNGYRYAERVALKPGIYQARIGILETATEQIGTATTWLEVPDLTKRPLTLSAILLTRDQDASRPSTKNASQIESLSPAVTQGITVYNPGADLDYHLVVHSGAGKDLRINELQMQLEIAQGDRVIYTGQWSSVEPRVVEKDNKGIEVGGTLTLNGIKPGVYELRVTVKGPNSKKPVQRVVAFGVEP
jgi:VWFA-related protein